MEPRLCQLTYAVGRSQRCPGETCPFWADDHCAVSPLWPDLAGDAHLAELMLEVRDDLARLSPHRTFRLFHPPGLA
jgi:hypothetical protein